jgi:hypothetical protein
MRFKFWRLRASPTTTRRKIWNMGIPSPAVLALSGRGYAGSFYDVG